MKRVLPLFIIAVSLLPSLAYAQIDASEIISEINIRRADSSLPALVENAKLDQAAKSKVQELADLGFLKHSIPQSDGTWLVLDNAGYAYKMAGENLAVHIFDSQDLAAYWMTSPSHRKNILNPEFKDIGVAVIPGVYAGENSFYMAAYFGTPKQENSIPAGSDNSSGNSSNEKQIAELTLRIKNLQRLLADLLSLLNTYIKVWL
jgi:hypothetical protein